MDRHGRILLFKRTLEGDTGMAKQSGDRSLHGYLAISVCLVGISFSPLFYKLGFSTGLNALWLNVFRLGITVLIMAGITFSNPKLRKELFSVSKRSFWISALAGTLLALHLNGWALSIVYTDTFAASTILGTYVLFTVLFSVLILKEKISKGALGGLLVATAGVVICNLGGGFGRLSGNMMALFAAVTEALYLLCGRKAREDMSTISYTMILYSFTLFWMVIMALFTGVPASVPAKGLLWAGLLAVVSTLLGHSMANVSLKYFKAATVSALMMSGIVTGPLIVFLFLGDVTTLFSAIGGTIILVGIAWYMRVEWRESKIAQSTQEAIAESIME